MIIFEENSINLKYLENAYVEFRLKNWAESICERIYNAKKICIWRIYYDKSELEEKEKKMESFNLHLIQFVLLR